MLRVLRLLLLCRTVMCRLLPLLLLLLLMAGGEDIAHVDVGMNVEVDAEVDVDAEVVQGASGQERGVASWVG